MEGEMIRPANYIPLFEVGGVQINLSESICVQWIVVVILLCLFAFLGRKLEVRPTGLRQTLAETIVEFFQNTVRDSMGEKFKGFTPYIGALFCMSLISNLMGLLGFRTPTSDLSVVGAWGITTFVMVQVTKIRTGGAFAPITSLSQPVAFMTPFNIIGEFANPASQTLRHFGNMVAGLAIGSLIYSSLGHFAILVPAAASLYFDLFAALVQAFIFMSLTMAYVSSADCSADG
ncbi:ATP synthase subunit a [Clostridia bacterium]|nr:ATP synthase subunit a [Clostridia bacterium]